MQQAVIEYILNALWQVPLLAGGAWLLVKAVGAGPRLQHLVWLAVLATALLLPLAGMGASNPPTPLSPQPTAAMDLSQPLSHPAADEQPPWWQLRPLPRAVYVRADYGRWLVRLYLASVVLGTLRLARAWHQARSLVAHSRATTHYREALANASQRLAVRLPCLRESAEVSSPMVVGALRPVLLLPQGFERFTDEEIIAALCHELAHIQRRDFLVNAICQVAALPLIWHPVLHAIEQRIHITREMICDGMAAAGLESKIGYARCLLTLAHSILASPQAAGEAQVLNLFGNHTLEERMTRLTETTTVTMRRQAARVAAGATMMIAAVIVAAMLHVTPTMAQASAPALPAQDASAANVGAAASVSEVKKTSTGMRAHAATQEPRPQQLQRELAQQKADTIKIVFDNAQFKRQTEEARRQAAKARALVDSPEFQRQMEQARQQAAKAKALVNSPEFKKQIEDARQEAARATALVDSPEFKRQMEDARQQAANARALVNSPEFKKQMEDARREAAKARALVNSPEFKKQIEDARRVVVHVDTIVNMPDLKLQMEDLQKELSPAVP